MSAIVEVRHPVWSFSVGDWRTGFGSVDLFSEGSAWVVDNPPTLSVALDSTAKMQVSLKTFGGAVPITETETDLWVRRNGKLLFRGRCMPDGSTDSGSSNGSSTTFSFADYAELLNHRILFEDVTYGEPIPTTEREVLVALLAYTQGLPGGSLGVVAGPLDDYRVGLEVGPWSLLTRSVVKQYKAGTTIWAAMTELSEESAGPELYVSPGLQLLAYQAVDKGAVLDFGGTVAAYSRATGGTVFANAGLQAGKGIAPVTREAAGIGSSPRGRWETAWTSEISTPDELSRAADKSLTLSQEPVPSWTLDLAEGAWKGPDHIWVGDIVSYKIRDGRHNVSTKGQVVGIDVTLNPDGGESVKVTINRPTPRFNKAFLNALADITKLKLSRGSSGIGIG